jgi:hypothetical protein
MKKVYEGIPFGIGAALGFTAMQLLLPWVAYLLIKVMA